MPQKSNDLLVTEYLKNEKIQIAIRLTFIFVFAVSIVAYNFLHPQAQRFEIAVVLGAPVFVFSINLIYLYIIKRYPGLLQRERIILALFLDISLTVYVMYLVDDFAAYYAGSLLWFSVAYGMRYSKQIAYIAYITVIVTWTTLLLMSDFWSESRNFAYGWLIAYIVLPLYYFKLVDKLHSNVEDLQNYASESTHKALHDQLTGMSNRTLFEEDLREFIQYYKISREKFALFFVDLDAFKEINDLHGHDVGDRVLVEASKRVRSVIEDSYRLGGDEFVAIVKYESESQLQNIAKSLMFNLTMPCKDNRITISASIGIACFPDDAITEFDIKKRADIAMYSAKESGKNRYVFYSDTLTKKTS
jgi:diguanylate cyclase (GGDEF)-like protein